MRPSKLRRKQQRENMQFQDKEVRQKAPQPNTGLELTKITPMTFTQARVFRDYEAGEHLVLNGYAGTGKTFLALYLALRSIKNNEYQKVIVVRSLVPTRNIGFLPGEAKGGKSEVYEAPYIGICNELYNRSDAYSILKQKKIVHFDSTSFNRGITIDNAIIIVDEAQNLTLHEMNTMMTRVGNNCRVIVSGDYRQTDLEKQEEKSGFKKALSRLQKMNNVSFIEFQLEDIVRSGFCREWIETEFDD